MNGLRFCVFVFLRPCCCGCSFLFPISFLLSMTVLSYFLSFVCFFTSPYYLYYKPISLFSFSFLELSTSQLLLYYFFCLMFSYVSFFLLFFSGVFLFLLHFSFLSLSLSLSPSLFFFLLSRYPPLSTSFPSFSLLPFHLLLLVSVFVSSS